MRKININNLNHWFSFMDNMDYFFILTFKITGTINKANKGKFCIIPRHIYVLSRFNK